MRRVGCWLLAAGLVVLGCLAASGCRATSTDDATRACRDRGGAPVFENGYYARCDFPPQPCGSLPAEVGP